MSPYNWFNNILNINVEKQKDSLVKQLKFWIQTVLGFHSKAPYIAPYYGHPLRLHFSRLMKGNNNSYCD